MLLGLLRSVIIPAAVSAFGDVQSSTHMHLAWSVFQVAFGKNHGPLTVTLVHKLTVALVNSLESCS